jgi:DNA ligase (NAD+)
MDIPMIGRTASKELSRQFNSNLDTFEEAVTGGFDFTQLKDFGETLNRNIHKWFGNKENLYLWKELQKMTTIEQKEAPATKASVGNPFVDCTIVVTGKLALFTRSTINAKIETLGAKAGSAISKNTDYLICGDKAGSKLDKARSLGVKVLSEQEFLNMAEGA